MDAFELNKIVGAIVMALLLTFGIGLVSNIMFMSSPPAVPGYQIALDGGGGAQSTAKAEDLPLEQLLAEASVEKGAKVARKCAACHSFEQGGPNKVGPNLWNVLGRKPASHEGFSYSAAMQAFGQETDVWTFERIDTFVTKPKDYISGTAMAFAGLSKARDRADLLAYLNQQNDAPKPLK